MQATVEQIEAAIERLLPALRDNPEQLRRAALELVALKAGTGTLALSWVTHYPPGWIAEVQKDWISFGVISAGRISARYVLNRLGGSAEAQELIRRIQADQPVAGTETMQRATKRTPEQASEPPVRTAELPLPERIEMPEMIERNGQAMPDQKSEKEKTKKRNQAYQDKLMRLVEEGRENELPPSIRDDPGRFLGRERTAQARAKAGTRPVETACSLPQKKRTRRAIAVMAEKAAKATEVVLPPGEGEMEAMRRNREQIQKIAVHPMLTGDTAPRVRFEVIDTDDLVVRVPKRLLAQASRDVLEGLLRQGSEERDGK